MADAARCCFIPCDRPAEYSIWSPPDPNGVTEACTAHVGALLSDARCEVWPLADREGGDLMQREHASRTYVDMGCMAGCPAPWPCAPYIEAERDLRQSQSPHGIRPSASDVLATWWPTREAARGDGEAR